mgnify:CR=1 FL=1
MDLAVNVIGPKHEETSHAFLLRIPDRNKLMTAICSSRLSVRRHQPVIGWPSRGGSSLQAAPVQSRSALKALAVIGSGSASFGMKLRRELMDTDLRPLRVMPSRPRLQPTTDPRRFCNGFQALFSSRTVRKI